MYAAKERHTALPPPQPLVGLSLWGEVAMGKRMLVRLAKRALRCWGIYKKTSAQNRSPIEKRQGGTKAKRKNKCSLYFRQAPILQNPMLPAGVFAFFEFIGLSLKNQTVLKK